MKQIIPPDLKLDQTFLKTPAGFLKLQASGEQLYRIDWCQEANLSNQSTDNPLLKETIKQLQEYFSGRRQKFELPWQVFGTEFQQAIWHALYAIPYGKTISYKALATAIDRPKACRAAGSANGKNPLSILVPCHRVIAADGSIGGYTGGLDKKNFLLQHEQNHQPIN